MYPQEAKENVMDEHSKYSKWLWPDTENSGQKNITGTPERSFTKLVHNKISTWFPGGETCVHIVKEVNCKLALERLAIPNVSKNLKNWFKKNILKNIHVYVDKSCVTSQSSGKNFELIFRFWSLKKYVKYLVSSFCNK